MYFRHLGEFYFGCESIKKTAVTRCVQVPAVKPLQIKTPQVQPSADMLIARLLKGHYLCVFEDLLDYGK